MFLFFTLRWNWTAPYALHMKRMQTLWRSSLIWQQTGVQMQCLTVVSQLVFCSNTQSWIVCDTMSRIVPCSELTIIIFLSSHNVSFSAVKDQNVSLSLAHLNLSLEHLSPLLMKHNYPTFVWSPSIVMPSVKSSSSPSNVLKLSWSWSLRNAI